jgi:Glycosyl transferase family 2
MSGDVPTKSISPRGTPRLTIVIPTVNRASLVCRALDSALAQTYPDIEIIVSNNGSTDGTQEILDRYDDPRLTVIHRSQTIPVNLHGNLLIERARGKFFLGLSDDDWLEPDFATKVVALWDRRPDLAFVWTGCLIHYADVVVPARTGPDVESGPEFLAGFLANRRNICWCACVTRTADLRHIGPIPPEVVCGDMFYWTKLAALGDVGFVADPVSHYVCYRDGGDGIAGGSRVREWGSEMETWARDILRVWETTLGRGAALDAVRREAMEFVARSTADQFVWNALRGVKPIALLRSVGPALPYLRGGHPSLWIRVVASIAGPRWLLRNRVLAEARRKAKAAIVQRL